ncbi:unnamed protein product [Adineta steineri]|uniref:Apple domain-containing protein n=1 Tax=Adineta steineri TaxID=433720 RepID=A0A814AJS7_9BILA|nr:unnamed protein product [Adineta steineri]
MLGLRLILLVVVHNIFLLNSSIIIRKLSSRIYIPLSSLSNPSTLLSYTNSCEECLCYGISSTTPTFVAMNCLLNIYSCQFYSNYSANYSIEWNSTSDFYFFEIPPTIIALMNEISTETTTTLPSSLSNTETMSIDYDILLNPSSYACGNMTVLIGYDLYGNDMDISSTLNYSDCCRWCQSNSSCVAYAWVLPTGGGTTSICYLKRNISSPTYDSRLVTVYI